MDVDLADRGNDLLDADQAIAVAIGVRAPDVYVSGVLGVVIGHHGVQFKRAWTAGP